ncbi:septum formation protein Maf [Sphingomonas lacunae]|uniref:Nucleoside triphosphate pyrophosphatase n=1 Tax=Sphingomonas lacunae TaxID=2698828 RepID=A0A6M4AS37_9SPHN|nr:Maf family protein [Sphingomonas lacunae]QJQ31867.1 septum formation protein Maf [Sphingomonas lacunae]
MTGPLILASQSFSRRAMLDAAGVSYDACPAHVDEDAVKQALLREGQPARAVADALAELKALKISLADPTALVIGSDSVVSVDGRLFDKPVSRANAAEHLRAFSGKTMLLTSAVVLAEGGQPVWRHVGEARLDVWPLSESFIDAYLDAEWPAIAGCVGCFRIEGPGVQLFSALHGDYFTILGMPLLPLLGQLRQMGHMPA